jgi:integrase
MMETSQRATTQIVLDTRSVRPDKTLPLKLRVTFERKPRVFGIKIKLDDGTEIDSISKSDFENVKNKKKKEPEKFTEIREKLSFIETEAREIIKKLDPFTFNTFRDKFAGYKKASEPGNVFLKYDEKIKKLEENSQLGSASNYDLSLKSLKTFIKSTTGKDPEKLYFKDITVNWLRKYQTYMTSDKTSLQEDGTIKIKPGLTETTVGFYLRALRAVFHRAINDKEIDATVNPFGLNEDDLYQIPTGDNVKKALIKDDLKKLFNAIALTPQQELARDFFFFIYQSNGLNVRDICNLKNSNLDTDSFSFYRKKTKGTTKKPKLVKVMLTDYSKTIIAKYRNKDTSPTAYLFPILLQTDSEKEKYRKSKNYISTINLPLKILAKSVGVTGDISTYFARHSFATLAIQGGASIEFISKSFGHTDTKTTENYFAGFQDSTHKKVLESLMDFNN